MKQLAEMGYKNIEHDMEDCHANYYTATDNGQSVEIKITHDGSSREIYDLIILLQEVKAHGYKIAY